MSHRMSLVVLSLLIFFLIVCQGPEGHAFQPPGSREEASSANGLSLYVIAPANESTRTNVMPMEAALRAVAIEAAGRGADVRFVPVGQQAKLPAGAWPRLEIGRTGSFGPHSRRFIFRTSSDSSVEVADIDFTPGNWRQLRSRVGAACELIMKNLERELSLQPASGSPLSEADKAALERSLDTLVRSGPSSLPDSSEAIDRVLSRHPSNPEALIAACWPSCVTASQDLHGYFHSRQKFLAVPLGWYTAAARAGASGPLADITEAWVALVCGFPNDALAILNRVQPSDSLQPLVTALEVFSTRDWRTLSQGWILSATAMEQLAWLWALQESQLLTENIDAVRGILAQRMHPAFAAVYDHGSVGSGHVLTSSNLIWSTAWIFRLGESLGIIDDENRQSLTASMPAGLRRAEGAAMVTALYAHFETGGGELESAGIIRAARAVLAAMADAPDGPLRPGHGDPAWQSLSPWAQSEAAGGLFYRSLEQRAYFLLRSWGVEDRARAFMGEVADALGTDDAQGHFFALTLLLARGRNEAATERFEDLMQFEMGRAEIAMWYVYGRWMEQRWLEEVVRNYWRVYHHPYGAYQSELLVLRAPEGSARQPYTDWYKACVANDPLNKVRIRAAEYENADSDHILRIARSAPYNLRLTRRLAWRASRAGHYDLAEELLNMGIAVAPDAILNYRDLADVYISTGNTDAAIEVLQKGIANAPYSLTVSHCQATLSRLLIEAGRIDEALDSGGEAAVSYSSTGLSARARALDAAGRHDEALEVYRLIAERYPTGAFSYLVYAYVLNKPAGEIEQAARELASRSHSHPLAPYIVGPLTMYGSFDVAAELLETALAPEDPSLAEVYWGDYYLMKREFAQAVSHYDQAIEEQYFARYGAYGGEHVAMRMYIALCLEGNREGMRVMKGWFARFDGTPEESKPLFAYMRGEATRQEALSMTDEEGSMALDLYWIFAAECEQAAQRDEAAQWYRRASEHPMAHYRYAGRFAQYMLAQ